MTIIAGEKRKKMYSLYGLCLYSSLAKCSVRILLNIQLDNEQQYKNHICIIFAGDGFQKSVLFFLFVCFPHVKTSTILILV